MGSSNPMELDCCPLCLAKGRRSSLTFFRMSLKESALLCSNMQCPFPLGTDYDDVFIQHEISDSDDDISEGSESEDDVILKAFPLLNSSSTDFKYSPQKDSGNEKEIVESQLPSMNLRLLDINTSHHSGSSISQDKVFSCNTPTDELHQMLKTSDGLEFDDIESYYLSTNNSVLSAEGYEEFDSILSDLESQESSKLKENESLTSKTPSSNKADISKTLVSSSVMDHTKSAHSSCSKVLYSPSSQLSCSQDAKKSLPEISATEKIQVWMKTVPHPKSGTSSACKKHIPELQSAGDNTGTILYSKYSSDLSPNIDSCPSATNNKEYSCDQHSSENCQDTSYSVPRKDENISQFHRTVAQHGRGDTMSDLSSTSDNAQELSGDHSFEKPQKMTHLNTYPKCSNENTLDVLTSVENDTPENNLYTCTDHVSNSGLCGLSSTNSRSSNDQQSSEKHLETCKWSLPAGSAEDENMSYMHMLHADNRTNNIPSTSRYDYQESSNNQQYCERLPKIFDTISPSSPSGNENSSNAGPPVLCGEATNKSYNYREEQVPLATTNYPGTKLTNGSTDTFSPNSSKSTPMCCDTVYTDSCENLKTSACNETPCMYSETSNEILEVFNLFPQQDRSIEHMSGTQSSSRMLNTVIIECTENIPLPSAGDLGANVVEFSVIRENSESKGVHCSYKIVKYDSLYASHIQDEDNHFSGVLDCEHCRILLNEQSRCKCCETRVCNYSEEQDISCASLWTLSANLTESNNCRNSHFLQCEECSSAEVSLSPSSNRPLVSSNIEETTSSQREIMALKELPHIQEHNVSEEIQCEEYSSVEVSLSPSSNRAPVSSDIKSTASSQMEIMTLKELPHTQECNVSQETSSTENSNSTDPHHSLSQQETVNHKSETDVKSQKKVQKNKTNRTKKGKNKRVSMSQQKGKAANKPRFNKQDVIAAVVRLDFSDFNGDLELTLL